MAASESALRELARRLTQVEKRTRQLSTPQLANSSIEDGAVRAYEGDSQTMQIGRQWDGTYAPVVTNGPVPPTPSKPIVTGAVQGLVIEWDGSFAGGLIPAPMNFLRVDAHVGALSDFIPDHSNRLASFVAPQGGSASVTLPEGTYFVKLVCWNLAGKVSAASEYEAGTSAPPAAGGSDGNPPDLSPNAEVVGGYEALSIRWTAIPNMDPVRYQIHASTTSGFTPDVTTLAGSTSGTQFTLKLLPGDPPSDPSEEDLRKLQYDTTYYVRIIAEDDDGEAPPGAQASDTIFKIQGGAIGSQTIVGDNILGNSITADKLSSTLILSSEIWTSMAGQRVGMTPEGFFAFHPDESLMLKIPTDGSNALFDGELVVRGATVTGGMSIQSSENELTADAALTLMRGITPPQASPQFADNYEKWLFSTSVLTDSQKIGKLGTFDLIPSEVTYIHWAQNLLTWYVYQVRSAGTRRWYFNIVGQPMNIGGKFFDDNIQYLYSSQIQFSTSSVPEKNGWYTLFYWQQDSRWWLGSPAGFDVYIPQNPNGTPRLGTDGEDMFISEIMPNGSLSVRYFVPPGESTALPAPIRTHTTTTGFTSGGTLAACIYSASGFDRGPGARYMTAEFGVNYNAKLLTQNGTTGVWYPAGSGNSWSSPTAQAETFEAPTTNRRGIAWDGAAFYSFHSDGYLYKHTSEQWDAGTGASTVHAKITFRDTDSGGTGTHETLPGPDRTFFRKRRSRWQVTLPPPPDNGGPDDANEVGLYVGVGSSEPANSAMYRQYSGLGPVTLVSLNTTNPNPPTIGTFPDANPAIIRSDDDALQIKGDASVKGKAASFTTVAASSSMVAPVVKKGASLATGRDLATEGPYWVGYLSTQPGIPAPNTLTTLTGWTDLESAGITRSGGTFTIPEAGLYRLGGQIWWAAWTGATGTRLTQAVQLTPSGLVLASVTVDAHATGAPSLAQFGKLVRFAAGATVIIRFQHDQSSGTPDNRRPTATTQDISFFQISWERE